MATYVVMGVPYWRQAGKDAVGDSVEGVSVAEVGQ